MARFPDSEWLQILMEKLNSDAKYARTARGWEGDMNFVIEPGGVLGEARVFYLDLWHGKCREVRVLGEGETPQAAFTLSAPYDTYVKLLKGEIQPMQGLLTRKISVKGPMTVLMRNVPTVLDFVRCCREITDEFL